MIRKSYIKYILFFVGLIFILTLAVVSYRIGSEPGFFEKKDTNEFIYDNFSNYIIQNKLLYEQNKEYVRAYHLKTGAIAWEIRQNLNNPAMKIINKELIAFEKNGIIIQRLDKRGVSKEVSIVPGQIYSIIETNDNLAGIIYKREGFKTSLLLIDKAFTLIFERAYGDSFVAEALFVGKNQIAILLNTPYSEILRSYIEIVDINSGNVLYEKTLGEDIFSCIKQINKDTYLLISSNQMLLMNNSFQITQTIEYDGREAIYDVSIFEGSIYTLVGEKPLSMDSVTKAKRLDIIRPDGSTKQSFEIDQKVKRIWLVDDLIIGISDAQVYVYDMTGEFLYNIESDDIIEEIIEYKSVLYFLHNNKIRKITP